MGTIAGLLRIAANALDPENRVETEMERWQRQIAGHPYEQEMLTGALVMGHLEQLARRQPDTAVRCRELIEELRWYVNSLSGTPGVEL